MIAGTTITMWETLVLEVGSLIVRWMAGHAWWKSLTPFNWDGVDQDLWSLEGDGMFYSNLAFQNLASKPTKAITTLTSRI